MVFKHRRGFALSYVKQGKIYFTCRNYLQEPEQVQQKIRCLCDLCGGAYSKALFIALTTERSLRSVAMEYYVSEATLWRAVKKFYQNWQDEKIESGRPLASVTI